MTDEERIIQLEKENEELKKELEVERNSHSDAWEISMSRLERLIARRNNEL